jgi:hypothetical protein
MKTISWEQRVRIALSDADISHAIELLQKTGDLSDEIVEMIETQALELCAIRLMHEDEA